MAALPYMPLYVADYLADAAHLSTMGHGAYLLLIMTYWQRGEALPDDERKLARIARMTDSEWQDVREDLREFFDVRDGQWTHKRIERELDKVRSKSSAASDAGKASARKRLNGRSTDVQRTFNHTDTDTDTDTDTERKIDNPIHLSKAAREIEPAHPVAKPFPPNGTIRYGDFAEISRKAKPGIDPDVVAQAFRKFCKGADPPIPFDDPRIAKRFEGFAKSHRITGH